MLYIVILKEMLQDQVYLHHGELRFSPDQNLSQWFSQNKNEPLVRLSDRGKCFQEKDSTNTKDI